MQHSNASVYAAIDIGSNTVHLVVARCSPSTLEILADEVDLVRIGESVTENGSISDQKASLAIASLLRFKKLAAHYGTQQVFVVATEAIRRAKNNGAFLASVREESGLEVLLISGEVEATLTFYGATYDAASSSQVPRYLGVMDLGGGSTELVLAKDMAVTWRTSLSIGSGWLYDRYFGANHPVQEDMAVAQAFLRSYLRALPRKNVPPLLIVTGGTANTLLYMAHQAFGLDSALCHLHREDLLRCEGLLSALPAEEISDRYRIEVGRARILPAGSLIIRSLMEHWRLDTIHISAHGVREGTLLAFMRYGEHWLQEVERISVANNAKKTTRLEKCPASFVATGRALLNVSLERMLEWRDEVLEHEDIEAVHKMRVASRRLRAVLDAYQPVCARKPFKKAYRQVKDLASILGKARDTDVMIAHLQSKQADTLLEEQAGVSWLIERLDAYRQRHQKALAAFLRKLDTGDVRREVEACLPRRT